MGIRWWLSVTESKHDGTVDSVTSYASEVLSGRILAGKLVQLACQRHITDLEQGLARGLRFDSEEAQATIEFWETCPHLKGRKWAGSPMRIEPWQRFIIGSVYGWKRADGTRRFRCAWVEVARKNGKSTLLYPAALHGLALDGEAGAEVYSVATKKDQARLVFDLAKRAVSRSPDLAELIQPYAFSLTCEETFGKFEALSSDSGTLDGLNPSVALCDEIHKWPGRTLWDVIETGMGARDQPLLWAITTAGDEGEEDVYGQEHNHSVQVLEGVIPDDSRFAYIACLDPEDDWTDPKHWIKANPNLGVSVQSEEIGQQVLKAKHTPAAANAVKRLRLGLRTQDTNAWIPLELWDRGKDKRITWELLAGLPCYAGLDLASTTDFACLALCFPLNKDLKEAADSAHPDILAYLWKLWMPIDGKTQRENKLREIVRPWVDAGLVEATSGDSIDSDMIEGAVKDAAEKFQIKGLTYDPFNAATIATHLQQDGIEITKFTQSMSNFAEPTRLFEADLLAGTVRHGGNPCVRWMINNCVVVGNAAGHRMPSRKRSKQKIDGVVAAVMSRGRASVGDAGGTGNWYEKNGVEII